MDASNKLRNVRQTLYTWLATLTLTGTPNTTVDGAPQAFKTATVRYQIEPVSQVLAAVDSSGDHTFRGRVLLIADLWFPLPSIKTAAGVYDLDQAADDLRDAFSLLNVPLKDYSVDPNSPTTLDGGHVLRSLGPAGFTRLSHVDNYQRARVSVVVMWDAYHTA